MPARPQTTTQATIKNGPRRWLVPAALAAGGLLAWWAIRYREQLSFYYRLFWAKRAADRFYLECPQVTRNILYYPKSDRRLDVYRPEAGEGHPVFVFVYGGSWNYAVPGEIVHARTRGWSDKYLHDVMGGRENIHSASPINFATSAAPPSLLIHGDLDRTVPVSQSIDLHQRLRAAGAQTDLRAYAGAGHSDLLFEATTENPSRLITDFTSFVRAVTAVPAAHSLGLAQSESWHSSAYVSGYAQPGQIDTV